MQIVQFGQKLNTPIVICLGYFGSMHLGHQKLLEVAKRRADELNAKVALFTFSNNHLKVLGMDCSVVYTFEERLSIYENLGIDYVIAAEFDDSFRKQSGAQFVELLKKYNLKGVVCGFDYTCGRDRMNAAQLSDSLNGVCSVYVVDAICLNGEKISTSRLREMLLRNDLEKANALLSEPYFLVGKVVSGRHVGSQIGFPTANLQISGEKELPLGVYGGQTVVDGKLYRAIVNVGQKPTFGLDYVNVEAHLLDFEGDLYGKQLKVALTKYLRPISKFNSAQELIEQLKKDRGVVLND